MRISKKYQNIIKENSKLFFGKKTRVYLFGSRVDDKKKGGDIDLFIEPDEKTDLLEKKIKYITRLNFLLGEQKIDVVIAKEANTSIGQIAKKTVFLLLFSINNC